MYRLPSRSNARPVALLGDFALELKFYHRAEDYRRCDPPTLIYTTPSQKRRNDFKSGSRENEAEKPHRTDSAMNVLSDSF
jgi:hypothetical protein